MCLVCRKIRKRPSPLNSSDTSLSLKDIEKAIKSGSNPNHFESLVDEILGTGLSRQDGEANQAWELKNMNHG